MRPSMPRLGAVGALGGFLGVHANFRHVGAVVPFRRRLAVFTQRAVVGGAFQR